MATTNHFKLETDHLESIKALAEENHLPVDDVMQIYASAFESLKTRARIQDYLQVLTSKKVRDELRH
jgi:hypothetical protein